MAARKQKTENSTVPETNTKQTEPDHNIRFVGKNELEPLETINGGSFAFILPDSETQKIGFHHPNAKSIVALFPDRYKLIRAKSE